MTAYRHPTSCAITFTPAAPPEALYSLQPPGRPRGIYRPVDTDAGTTEWREIAPRSMQVAGYATNGDERLVLLHVQSSVDASTYDDWWVDQEDLAGTRGLCALARYGFPIDETNARALVKYFRDSLDHALRKKEIPIVTVVRRSGHVRGGYVLGDRVHGNPTPHVVPLIRGEIQRAMRPVEGVTGLDPVYLDALRRTRTVGGSPARFVLAASLVSVLLYLLGLRTIVIHLYGMTKRGKTALLKLGLAGWGRPDALMATVNATQIALGEQAAELNDQIMAIDDVTAPSAVDNRRLIYELGQGKSRGRARREGGLQERKEWRLVIMTTGEVPLVSSEDTGGAGTRVIQVAFETALPDDLAKHIHTDIAQHHYGSLVPRFVDLVLATPIDDLRRFHDRLVAEIRSALVQADGTIPEEIDRHVAFAAAVAVADYALAREILREEDGDDQIFRRAVLMAAQVLATSASEIDVRPIEERGLATLHAIYESNKARFAPNAQSQQGTPTGRSQLGESRNGDMYFFHTEIDRELISRKIDPQSFWRAMKRRGWLKYHGRETTVKSGAARYYVVTNAAWNGVEGAPNEQ